MSTILVADDNSNIQKMVALALKDAGIGVVAVGNGDAAVRKLPEVRPDLILADVFMPVRSGYELCEFVKRDERFAHIPVVLLVGAFDPLDEREAQRVGADGVLKKPFVPPDPLVTMVKSLLARSATEHPEPLVPVAAGATERLAETASAQRPEPAPAESEEPQVEEFGVYPSRLTFGEGEKPVMFGELLQTPATAESSVEPEVTAFSGAAIGEMKFWNSPAAADTQKSEAAAPSSEVASPRQEETELFRPVEFAAQELARQAQEEIAAPQDAASPAEQAEASAEPTQNVESPFTPFAAREARPEWASALPPIPMPLQGEATTPADPAETQVHSEQSAGSPVLPWQSAPEPASLAETPQDEAEPSDIQAPPPAIAWSEFAQETADKAGPWPNAFPTSPEPVEPPAEVAAEPAQPETPAVQSFGVPQAADSQTVDAVVERVLDRMKPQFMEIITREILKPVVEALVRRELEKR